MFFRQTRQLPDATLRVGLITASGGGDQFSRYFDSPGYFFDTTLAKSITLNNAMAAELRFMTNLGFLCWQVDTNMQNDAFLYGIGVEFDEARFALTFAWQGYSGWIENGDRPIVLKASFVYKAGHFRPLVAYQYGMRDYPFQQFRIGLGYVF